MAMSAPERSALRSTSVLYSIHGESWTDQAQRGILALYAHAWAHGGRCLWCDRRVSRDPDAVRIGLVLSGGGLRGASHLGVLQALTQQAIPIDVIVGASAGAVIAAYYAAVGMPLDELIADAGRFRGRHLLAHSIHLRLRGKLAGALTKHTGVIPERLEQLRSASFDRLHYGVRAIGVVCHDLVSGRP